MIELSLSARPVQEASLSRTERAHWLYTKMLSLLSTEHVCDCVTDCIVTQYDIMQGMCYVGRLRTSREAGSLLWAHGHLRPHAPKLFA